MAFSIAEMILLGLLMDWVFRKLHLPGLLGMLLLGILFGPYVFNLMAPGLVDVSADLRLIALIIILLRAGLELSREALNRVGRQAILLSFIPGIIEGITIAFFAPLVLPISPMEGAVLGFVLAAVSPAVVVPMMIGFIERGMGARKGIPTMIMGSAALDDVVAVVILSVLLGVYTGAEQSVMFQLAGIPISILTGIIVGLVAGWFLLRMFDRFDPRATKKTLILVGLSILWIHVQQRLEGLIPFSGLLAVMATGFIMLEMRESTAHEISSKLGKIWIFASILLFVLVGAQVDVSLLWKTGFTGLLIILVGLTARSIGVMLSLTGSPLSRGERWFTVVSFWPKATVQAAVGALPLLMMTNAGMDTAAGEIILAVAVLSIVVTAPVGSLAIHLVGEKVLNTKPIDSQT